MERLKDFCFINPRNNDMFSNFRGNDLQDLLSEIESFDLIYRKGLNLPESVTFGLEIEAEDIELSKARRLLDFEGLCPEWRAIHDGSLIDGAEIVSPVLQDEIKTWTDLKAICKFLRNNNVNTSGNAGGHIHIGADILGYDEDAWLAFIKTYAVYESILYRFGYGDKLTGRNGIYEYAGACADDFYYKIMRSTDVDKLVRSCRLGKYSGLNFGNINPCNLEDEANTLEFRYGNATDNEVIWQNNVNAIGNLVLSAVSGYIDCDFVDYKLEHERISSSELYKYDMINLRDALEFCDLIFDNNLDKCYFMRQYLKNFQDGPFGKKKTYSADDFICKDRVFYAKNFVDIDAPALDISLPLKNDRKIYFAYGSNLNLKQFAYRCPDSSLVGNGILKDHKLVYRGSTDGKAYLTIEESIGDSVPVGIFSVSLSDERLLDDYEGYPDFYYKENLCVSFGDEEIEGMVYIMHPEFDYHLPSNMYVTTCVQGYEDFGFDKCYLDSAYEVTRANTVKKFVFKRF